MAGRATGPGSDALLAANLDRLKQTARFRTLARRQLIWVGVQALSLLLAIAGSGLLVSRLMSVSITTTDQRGKDIVLCMDVSSSAIPAAEAAFTAYRGLIDGLTNERVGLVLWNSSSLTVFPLTNDYEFIATEMARAEEAVLNSAFPYLTGVNHGADQWGSSLVGDGLANCVQRFDQPDKQRPRTIVLSTDNEVDGQPVYTLADAVDLALERKVMVFGLAPIFFTDSQESPEVAELRQELQRTGGEVLSVTEQESSQVVLAAIARQEGTVFQSAPKRVETDLPTTGSVLLGLGLVGLLVGGWRTRQ